jgi:phosphoribosyl 1,2-cyclic phosphate phosphodiesterase
MRKKAEERLRTSLYLAGRDRILIDCGPDIVRQWWANGLEGVDAVLITHEHGDHYLGLDELVALRRSSPQQGWHPISTYATVEAWETIELRFAYLLEKTLEKKLAIPGQPLDGLKTKIIPCKTFHGQVAKGSVGFVIEEAGKKLVYTSDLLYLDNQEDLVRYPDVLIIQSHWLNEPEVNRPSLLSLQRALSMVRDWEPTRKVFLIHISDADPVPGDPANDFLKKIPSKDPLRDPKTGTPYPIPTCQSEWQEVAEQVFADHDIGVPVQVAYDGLVVEI